LAEELTLALLRLLLLLCLQKRQQLTHVSREPETAAACLPEMGLAAAIQMVLSPALTPLPQDPTAPGMSA